MILIDYFVYSWLEYEMNPMGIGFGGVITSHKPGAQAS